MIKMNEKLTFLFDDFGAFYDYSNVVADYSRGVTGSILFGAGVDYLYVGFEKPINVFYVEFSVPQTDNLTLTGKYYNGTAWTAMDGFYDDTDGFTRSGFVRWNRGQTNEAATTVNSTELYWYQFELDNDVSPDMKIKGLNIVFSDDQDLKRELFEISKYLPSGETSHILSHVAARDEIIQNLNVLGKKKQRAADDWWENISAFDLLDISEVKLASTYLTLSKILFSVSDDIDDIYAAKAQKYREMGMNLVTNMRLKVDVDDDGIYDRSENNTISSGEIVRL